MILAFKLSTNGMGVGVTVDVGDGVKVGSAVNVWVGMNVGVGVSGSGVGFEPGEQDVNKIRIKANLTNF